MSTLIKAKTKKLSINDIQAIQINLASPEKIRQWSYGEVKKPETINYRTFKPEKDGLFCAKIFGPISDWECLCGKYKKMKYKGYTCEKCGVEITTSKVRRERMGHIELAASVAHIWFFKSLPSRIGQLLNMTIRELEWIIYYESYIVIDPGDTPVKEKEVISIEKYFQLKNEYRNKFIAKTGAEALKILLSKLDLDKMSESLRLTMKSAASIQKKLKCAKQLKVVEAFRKSSNKPEWMILEVLPVMPPELRPLVPLDGGRFASSDLNDLYRRVINRNNRLKKLLELKAPEVIIRNEKRMLQEAVDALMDNGRRGRVLKGANKRPLKSLSDSLKGKQGRFRQNLLGKRVDYSGRSVIVVGPELKLNQCGIPKKMALELFRPFIYRKLEEMNVTEIVRKSKELVEKEDPKVWDALEEVIQEHPVFLNRAPTLHRLGIQAFEALLTDDKAIRIHPLVCAAYNADFDGDQMAVHVPLSNAAQIEASVLMLSTNNILSPAHGQPLAVPSQDIVLGCYYLTAEKPWGCKGAGKIFNDANEVVLALEHGEVETHSPIYIRITGKLVDLMKSLDDKDLLHAEIEEVENKIIKTTVGRVIFNSILPEGMFFINGVMKKKLLSQLVYYSAVKLGNEKTVELLDNLKDIGFKYATLSGFTMSTEDMVIPSRKNEIIQAATKEVEEVWRLYQEEAMTNRERYNRVIDIWNKATELISEEMFREMKEQEKNRKEFNALYAMAQSGARGSNLQIRQLAGIRGLMAKPSGEIMETPISSNLKEGLSVLQYFISTHGARKGLADTALKTADSGYLTRRLVDVAQDIYITTEDCHTMDGVLVGALIEGGEVIEELCERIIGRVALEDIRDPITGEIIIKANEIINEEEATMIQGAGIEKVKIRSVLTCECRYGLCQKCYGINLSTGKLSQVGEAVGIIAAQSIGEPGTQLTMRTFHIGGTASRTITQSQHISKTSGTVRFKNLETVKNKEGFLVAMNRNGAIVIRDTEGRDREKFNVVYGAKILVEDSQEVEPQTIVAEWDPYSLYILTEVEGTVKFKHIIQDVTLFDEIDETGRTSAVIKDARIDVRDSITGELIKAEDLQPQIMILDKAGREIRRYLMPTSAHLMVSEGQSVYYGDILAKMPREIAKTKDITGGLPRVVELFEARRPKQPAVITEVDGVVKFGGLTKGQRKMIIMQDSGTQKEYLLPRGAHIAVREGDRVTAGTPLMDGPVNPHDILKVLGEKRLQDYLVDEIQEVYRLQNVSINDKHIEIIVRQMMRWIKIEDVGDTDFLYDETIDKFRFYDENKRVMEIGGKPAKGHPVLLGITKASLSTDSFISAASFQETTRVLTEAAVNGDIDYLRGLKENVILGRLIPAGTGNPKYRYIKIEEDKSLSTIFGPPTLESEEIVPELPTKISPEELRKMKVSGEEE